VNYCITRITMGNGYFPHLRRCFLSCIIGQSFTGLDYMSNTVGVLQEAETAYPSWASGFTPFCFLMMHRNKSTRLNASSWRTLLTRMCLPTSENETRTQDYFKFILFKFPVWNKNLVTETLVKITERQCWTVIISFSLYVD
jgi:hypothetical protein